MNRNTPKTLQAAALVSGGVLLGLALAVLMPAPAQHRTVEWLATPKPVAEFTLASTAGPFPVPVSGA